MEIVWPSRLNSLMRSALRCAITVANQAVIGGRRKTEEKWRRAAAEEAAEQERSGEAEAAVG